MSLLLLANLSFFCPNIFKENLYKMLSGMQNVASNVVRGVKYRQKSVGQDVTLQV